jgi:hypothetical protein
MVWPLGLGAVCSWGRCSCAVHFTCGVSFLALTNTVLLWHVRVCQHSQGQFACGALWVGLPVWLHCKPGQL